MISCSSRLRITNDSTWFLFWETQIFHVYKTVYSSHDSVFDWCQIEIMNFYLSNNCKCFELKCFYKKFINYFQKNENNINDFLIFFSIFRRYAFKKTFNKKNFVFIIKINRFTNFKNFSTFLYKNIKIVLCRVFIFF